MKIHLPDLPALPHVDPVVWVIAGAGWAAFLLSMAGTWLIVTIGRRRRRRTARHPIPAQPQRQPRREPVHSHVTLLLPSPEPIRPAVSASGRPTESVLDFLPDAIEPYPSHSMQPRMGFIRGSAILAKAQPATAAAVPVPPSSRVPRRKESLGLPDAVWEGAGVVQLQPEQIIQPAPPLRLAAQRELASESPRKLGFIRLKPKARPGENSAVTYSRRQG